MPRACDVNNLGEKRPSGVFTISLELNQENGFSRMLNIVDGGAKPKDIRKALISNEKATKKEFKYDVICQRMLCFSFIHFT